MNKRRRFKAKRRRAETRAYAENFQWLATVTEMVLAEIRLMRQQWEQAQ